MNIPPDLNYTEHDEWIGLTADVVTIGITDFAQDALGELVHIELPDVGQEFTAGDVVCEVESVKAVAEVYTPVGGKVIEVNNELDGAEDSVNKYPYGKGWLVRLRVTSTLRSDLLLDSDEYRAKTEST